MLFPLILCCSKTNMLILFLKILSQPWEHFSALLCLALEQYSSGTSDQTAWRRAVWQRALRRLVRLFPTLHQSWFLLTSPLVKLPELRCKHVYNWLCTILTLTHRLTSHLHLSPAPSSSHLCWSSGPVPALQLLGQWNELCPAGPALTVPVGAGPYCSWTNPGIQISNFRGKTSVHLALNITTTTTCEHHHVLVHVFTEHSIPSSKNIRFGPIIKDVTQAFILEVKFAYWPLFSMYSSSSATTKYSQCPKTIPNASSQLPDKHVDNWMEQCKNPRNIFLSLASITHFPGAF